MYDQKTLPVNRWSDPIGVSWDGNIFELRSGSFHKVDRYNYHINASRTIYTGTQSDEWAFASASFNGCTWYADLKGASLAKPVVGLYGYAEFILEPKWETAVPSYLSCQYFHKKGIGNLSIYFQGFDALAVTGMSNYDATISRQPIL